MESWPGYQPDQRRGWELKGFEICTAEDYPKPAVQYIQRYVYPVGVGKGDRNWRSVRRQPLLTEAWLPSVLEYLQYQVSPCSLILLPKFSLLCPVAHCQLRTMYYLSVTPYPHARYFMQCTVYQYVPWV